MRHLAFAWRTDADIQPILDRAQHYRDDVYTATGAPPDRFMVTAHEYDLLQMYYGSPADVGIRDEIQLFGMRVCRPERMAWYRDNRYMEHFKMLGCLGSWIHEPLSPISPLPLNPEICRTDRPLPPQRELPCPCGEVIWDMSTSTLYYVPVDAEMRMAWCGLMPRPAARVGTGMDDDPLPPLDDLDEGLQCCGKQHQTFAQFMAHRRQHGEG